jgi:cellulose biosynthesis protein BcsQ
MLVSIANTKGGQGKTPWARECAGYFEAELLDLNPENGDAYAWAQLANHPTRLVYEVDLAQVLQEAAASKAFYVADCPPWDGPETRMALAFSSAIMVPVSPSPQGLRGLGRMEDLLKEAREQVNPNLKAGIVGTGKRHGVSFNAGWEQALAEAHRPKEGTHFLGLMPQRQAFLDSFATGGFTFLGSDPEAGEVRVILDKFASLVKHKKH